MGGGNVTLTQVFHTFHKNLKESNYSLLRKEFLGIILMILVQMKFFQKYEKINTSNLNDEITNLMY